MKYNLKDKLIITKDFLSDLEEKSWQEIEHLRNQIANIEEKPENIELIKLLKNLLTSYYVFTGGLENLSSSGLSSKIEEPVIEPEVEVLPEIPEDDFTVDFEPDLPKAEIDIPAVNMDIEEPFEYFVDFDEPVGEPLTDDDLYNN